MYAQDSFFGLSPLGQVGLVCISTALFLLMLVVTRYLLAHRPVWVRLLGAFILFYLFVWISPQIYYQYYRVLIPSLPLQWVIWPPEHPLIAINYMIFQGPQSLSAHSQGILGWCLLAVPFPKRRQRQA